MFRKMSIICDQKLWSWWGANLGIFCVISFITEYNFFYFRLSLSRIAPLTSSLHLSLSFDTLVAWTQRSFFSPLMVLLQFFFGGSASLSFIPCGFHELTIFACLVFSILNAYPNHFHLLEAKMHQKLKHK